MKGTASLRSSTDTFVFIPNRFCMELIFFRIIRNSLLDGPPGTGGNSQVACVPQDANHCINRNNNRTTIYIRPIQKKSGPGCVVGIATGYGLVCPGIESIPLTDVKGEVCFFTWCAVSEQ